MNADSCTIVIADDDPLVRAAVRAILQAAGDVKVVGEAEDGAQALACVDLYRPDLLLLDLNMPNKAGLDALLELRERQVLTIVLTVRAEKRDVVQAIQFGARGFVRKSDASKHLMSALQAVVSGKSWFIDKQVENPSEFLASLPQGQTQMSAPLGTRELQVVQLVAHGLSNRDISQRIGASEQVVKNILTSVFNKLGVFNRVELALYAIDHGLVHRG